MSEVTPEAYGTVLITGSLSPLGQAIAKKLSAEGYRLLLHVRNDNEEARDFAQSLGSVFLIRGDLSDPASLRNIADIAIDKGVDILINNAAVFRPVALDSPAYEDQWRAIMEVNITAPFLLSRLIGLDICRRNKMMGKTQTGHIICISDAHSEEKIFPGYSPYLISKSALNSVVRSLAIELAPHVCVNAIAPGIIDTPSSIPSNINRTNLISHIPMRRLGVPDDVATAVSTLLKQTYCTGAVIPVDGGRSLI